MKFYVTERFGPRQRTPEGLSCQDVPIARRVIPQWAVLYFSSIMAASNSTPTRGLLLKDRVDMSLRLERERVRSACRQNLIQAGLPPASRLHRCRAGGLAPIIAPHSEERSMDSIGRLVEWLQVDPHHAAVVHAPRQAHQQAIDRLLAPVGNEC